MSFLDTDSVVLTADQARSLAGMGKQGWEALKHVMRDIGDAVAGDGRAIVWSAMIVGDDDARNENDNFIRFMAGMKRAQVAVVVSYLRALGYVVLPQEPGEASRGASWQQIVVAWPPEGAQVVVKLDESGKLTFVGMVNAP